MTSVYAREDDTHAEERRQLNREHMTSIRQQEDDALADER